MERLNIVIENDLKIKKAKVDVIARFKIDEFEFFIHRPWAWDIFTYDYCVSEKQSGCVIQSHDMIEDAVNYAMIEYYYRGRREIKKAIRKKIKKHGIANPKG